MKTELSLEDVDEKGNKDGEEEKKEMEFEEAFELTGHGRFNTTVMLTCGLIHLNVMMESIGMSYVVTPARCDLLLSDRDKGLLSASGFIGVVSTSLVWGYLCDTFGRRGVMLPAMLASALLSALSAFSINFWMMLMLRILTGCMVSASSATVYAYLGEMHSAAHRSRAIVWGCVFLSFCFMLLPGLAWIIIPGEWEYRLLDSLTFVPWRLFMLTWTVPCLVACAALFQLPESPKFLMSRKGASAALPVLAKMYACNYGTTPDKYPVKSLLSAEETACTASGPCVAVRSLLLLYQPPLLRCVLVSYFCIFAIFLLSSGMYMWVPDILNNLLTSSSVTVVSVCDVIRESTAHVHANMSSLGPACRADVSVALFPISIGVGALFAATFMLVGYLISRVGKKMLYGSIMCVCGLMAVAAGLVPHGALGSTLLVVSLSCGCCASILASIVVDVCPTEVRAMSMCLMYMVGRTGAVVGSNILGATLKDYCEESFVLFGVIPVGVVIALWPEPERVRKQLASRGFSF